MSAAALPRLPSEGPRSRRAITDGLIAAHFRQEPELEVVYVLRPRDANDPREPIKLLEVNGATLPSGGVITPFEFAPTADVLLPVVIAEITPDERDAVQAGTLDLPAGWSLDGALQVERR